MEGDIADLPAIADAATRAGARLMVDEAHGVGVLGRARSGPAELLGRRGPRRPAHGHVLQVAGLVRRLPVGRADVIEYLRISARPFMFTASAVPAATGAALAAVRICRSDEGPERFAAVLDNARYWHAGLRALAVQVGGATTLPDGPSSSRRSSPSSSATTGGGAPVARALRRRRLRQRRAAPGGAAGRRAACARASWPRTIAPRSTARSSLRRRQARLRGRARRRCPGPDAERPVEAVD
jgi:hypothetical protein